MDAGLYNAALAMLARRDHSKWELKHKLSLKYSVDNHDLQTLIETLESQGYQSDVRFADNYTRARMNKGFGPERIAFELREKGVDAEIVEVALAEYEQDWSALAAKVWRKKYNLVPLNFKEKAKQSSFLRYRGFRANDIQIVFDR